MTEQEQAQRAAVVAEARAWLGTPYHHHGAVKGVGVDCAMLPIAVYHACGLMPLIDPRPYPVDWMMNRSDEIYMGVVEQYAHAVEQPLPGDFALWQFGRTFSHGGIVIEWPLVVHAYQPLRQVAYSRADQGRLSTRPVRYYSLWGNG